jgi:hypothetical protein
MQENRTCTRRGCNAAKRMETHSAGVYRQCLRLITSGPCIERRLLQGNGCAQHGQGVRRRGESSDRPLHLPFSGGVVKGKLLVGRNGLVGNQRYFRAPALQSAPLCVSAGTDQVRQLQIRRHTPPHADAQELCVARIRRVCGVRPCHGYKHLAASDNHVAVGAA